MIGIKVPYQGENRAPAPSARKVIIFKAYLILYKTFSNRFFILLYTSEIWGPSLDFDGFCEMSLKFADEFVGDFNKFE